MPYQNSEFAKTAGLISVDLGQVIRLSLRCLYCGLIGAIPLVGFSISWVALQLQRRVIRETGDSLKLGPLKLWWYICLLFLPAYAWFWGAGGLCVLLAFTLSAQAYHLILQYRHSEPLVANPARACLFWGSYLACLGIAWPFLLFILVLIEAIPEFFKS